MALPVIGTLWVGSSVSWLEQLCLKSFLDCGHEVVVYSYDKISGLPQGIRTAPADDILPADTIIRHAKTGSPAYHADVFRLHMLAQTDMIWADTDAYCCKPWDIAPNSHFHGWISDAKPLVNNGVLGLPKDSKTLQAMLEFTSDEYPIPPWFRPEQRQKLERAKDRGAGVHVSLLPWGVWGPDALTHFLKETGEIEHAQPGHVIYPLPFAKAALPFNPSRHDHVAALVREDTLSVHFWGRRFRNIAARFAGVPLSGSYMAEILKKHEIDPVPTAHMMSKRRVAAEMDVAPGDLNFGAFETRDIADMILQRPDIIASGQARRDWADGNEEPLLALADANRKPILQAAFAASAESCRGFLDATDKLRHDRLADIGSSSAFADLILFRRYGCEIVLVGDTRATATAENFLIANGVPPDKIRCASADADARTKIGNMDLAVSLASCGVHYPVTDFDAVFRTQLAKGGGIVLDIRKGSGWIADLKAYGAVEVMSRFPKYSTTLVRVDAA